MPFLRTSPVPAPNSAEVSDMRFAVAMLASFRLIPSPAREYRSGNAIRLPSRKPHSWSDIGANYRAFSVKFRALPAIATDKCEYVLSGRIALSSRKDRHGCSGLVEVHDIRPHAVVGLGAWAALDGISWPCRVHKFLDQLRMAGFVVGAERHARVIFGNCLAATDDGLRFSG